MFMWPSGKAKHKHVMMWVEAVFLPSTRDRLITQMDELQGVLSDLLSLEASSSQLSNALDRLRGVLTAIALETGLRDGSTITKAGFLQLQESFLHNGESSDL